MLFFHRLYTKLKKKKKTNSDSSSFKSVCNENMNNQEDSITETIISVGSDIFSELEDGRECEDATISKSIKTPPKNIQFDMGVIPYVDRYSHSPSSGDYKLSTLQSADNPIHPTGKTESLFGDTHAEPYSNIPAYQRLKEMKQRIMFFRQRNRDIKFQLQRFKHETRLKKGRIPELRRENSRLAEENAVTMGKIVESRFLEASINTAKQEVDELTARYQDQEQKQLDRMRYCQNHRAKGRQLKSECQALEVISYANNCKVEKFSDHNALSTAVWRERRSHLLMLDRLQAEEGRLLVYARVKCDFSNDSNEIVYLNLPTDDRIGIPVKVKSFTAESTKEGIRYFHFNCIMGPSVSQQQVFEKLRHVVDTVFDERSACLLTYGASGTGKTHTLVGSHNLDGRGLLARSVEHLFRRIEDHHFLKIQLSASFLQIHAERITCLLSGNKVSLGDKSDFVSITGQRQVVVESAVDFCRLLEEASSRRVEMSGKSNEWKRSLDHMLVFIKLTFKNRMIKDKIERFFVACDLCAFTRTPEECEDDSFAKLSQWSKVADFTNHKFRMNSNALTSLQHVFQALNNGSATIPYRLSALTRILRPCLSGSALCATILTIVDDSEAGVSNLQTLQFGQMLMDTAMGHTFDKSKVSPFGSFSR